MLVTCYCYLPVYRQQAAGSSAPWHFVHTVEILQELSSLWEEDSAVCMTVYLEMREKIVRRMCVCASFFLCASVCKWLSECVCERESNSCDVSQVWESINRLPASCSGEQREGEREGERERDWCDEVREEMRNSGRIKKRGGDNNCGIYVPAGDKRWSIQTHIKCILSTLYCTTNITALSRLVLWRSALYTQLHSPGERPTEGHFTSAL